MKSKLCIYVTQWGMYFTWYMVFMSLSEVCTSRGIWYLCHSVRYVLHVVYVFMSLSEVCTSRGIWYLCHSVRYVLHVVYGIYVTQWGMYFTWYMVFMSLSEVCTSRGIWYLCHSVRYVLHVVYGIYVTQWGMYFTWYMVFMSLSEVCTSRGICIYVTQWGMYFTWYMVFMSLSEVCTSRGIWLCIYVTQWGMYFTWYMIFMSLSEVCTSRGICIYVTQWGMYFTWYMIVYLCHSVRYVLHVVDGAVVARPVTKYPNHRFLIYCISETGMLCPINGASYDQSLYDSYIVSHIWPFSLPYDIWPGMTLKGKINVIEFSPGLFYTPSMLWPKCIINAYIYEIIYNLSVNIMTFAFGLP